MEKKQPTLLSEMHDQVHSLRQRAIMYRNMGQLEKATAYANIADEIQNKIAKTYTKAEN